MKIRTIGLALAFCFLGVAACLAASPQIGTWKLNEAKSKATPGMGKVTMVAYKSMLGQVKVAVDGTDAKGKPTHNEWTGRFDGKDYPVTGDPTSDARSYTKVNDRTMNFAIRKAEKPPSRVKLWLLPTAKAGPSPRAELTRKAKSSRTSQFTTNSNSR